jgi:hypothetical protein
MIIYISGHISGRPDNNKLAFQAAMSRLWEIKRTTRFCTMKIINPITHIAKRLERQFAAKGKEPQWADYMRACIKKLVEADCVFFLEDWAKSDGASIERYIAKRLGIPCADNITELKKILEGKNENS